MKKTQTYKLAAGILAVITAVTPVASYAAEIPTLELETPAQASEEKFLFITLKNRGGSVVLNKNEDNQETVKLDYHDVKIDGTGKKEPRLFIDVYDKDEVLLSSNEADKNNNIYMYTSAENDIVTIDVISEPGYEILEFDKEGEVLDFTSPKQTFSYTTLMEEDAKFNISFRKEEDLTAAPDKEEKPEEDLTVAPDAGKETDTDLTVAPEDEAEDKSDTDSDLTVVPEENIGEKPDEDTDETTADTEDDLIIGTEENTDETENTEDSEENTDDLIIGSDDATVDDESDETTEDTTESDVDEATDDDLIITDDTEEAADDEEETDKTEDSNDEETLETAEAPEEHFTEYNDSIYDLDVSQFETARLVVLADNPDDIIDREHIIANYNNIYLMQYGSVEQSMNAYLYYAEFADSVEPDAVIATASEDDITGSAVPETLDDGTPIEVTAEQNPVAVLSEEVDSTIAQNENRVIALIDTGASVHPNVIDRVSLIDSVMEGNNSHANDMVEAIISQNPDARILSIRAMGDDGYGSIAAVVAGMEYAINSQVDIINLSMYSKKTLSSSVLEAEIKKASELGITVVGAAGNDGADVADYVPGSVPETWTIGAVTEKGVRQAESNYGELVDYYTVGRFTSDAAAKFSGYISRYGLDAAASDETGVIFTEATESDGGYENDDIYIKDENPDTEKTDDTIYDPVIENYVKANADKEYVGEGQLSLMNFMDIDATIADEKQLNPGETIDTLMANDSGFRFLIQHTGRVPVYQFNGESEYMVAFVDVMHNDKSAKILDTIVAKNDILGVVIDGCHFDADTGLLYIPRDQFYGEDGTYYFGYHQMQILYSISGFNIESQWNSSAVSATEESSGNIDSNISGDNILMEAMSVQVGKYMDVNTMLVSVNGLPIDGSEYQYDSESGMLTIGFSSSVVQSVWVQAEKGPNAPDVEPGMKVAWGADASDTPVTFEEAPAVSDKAITIDYKKVTLDYVMKDIGAKIRYVHTAANKENVKNGETVWGYRVNGYAGDHGKIVDAILKSTRDLANILGGKVYNVDLNSGYSYPFDIKLESIQDPNISFYEFARPESEPPLKVGMECTHTHRTGYTEKFSGGGWHDGKVAIHCVAMNLNTSKPWIFIAIYTSQITTQHGLSLIKLYVKPEGGGVELSKRLANAEMATRSDGVYIDTYLTVYTDKACKNVYKAPSGEPGATIDGKAFTGTVHLKETTDMTKSTVRIEGLKPGTYYVKETKADGTPARCPGTIHNTKTYKFVVVEGQTTKKIIDMSTNTEMVSVPNEPTHGRFKIIKKDKDDNKKKLAGAVFQVKYYPHAKADGEKADAIWYFQTDSKGEAGYSDKYFLKSFTNPETGQTVNSDDPITLANGTWYLPVQSYVYIREVYAPKGYALNKTTYELRIKPDADKQQQNGLWVDSVCPTAEIEIEDEPDKDTWKVRVQAKKVNESLKGLEGAEFRAYDNKECEGDWLAKLVSDSSGMTNIATIKDIPFSQEEFTVYLKETKAPAGYTVTDEIFEYTFTRAKYEELKAKGNESGELHIFGDPDGIVNKEGWKVRVQAKKVKEDLSPLAGAEFNVYPDPECIEEPYGTLISEADGMTNILTIGVPMDQEKINLFLKETKAPDGYTVVGDVYPLTFNKSDYEKNTPDGELKIFGPEDGNGIVNKEGWKVRVQAKKVNQNYIPLAGAVFNVYKDEHCIGDVVGTLTSGADGMTNIETITVPEGTEHITLYCKEVVAPAGGELLDKIFPLNFDKSVYEELKKKGELNGELKQFGPEKGIINNVTITPTPPTEGSGGLYIKKTSTVDPEILNLHSYSIGGAVFEVTPSRPDGASGTLTTEDDGISNSLTLPDNSERIPYPPEIDKDGNVTKPGGITVNPVTTTYYIKETQAPKGHKPVLNIDPVYVTMPNEIGATKEVKVEDEPYFCKNKLEVEKLGVKGEPIEGAVFKVEFFDSADGPNGEVIKTWYLESDANGRITLDDVHISRRFDYQSDPFFLHKGQIVIPIDCYMQFTEMNAPAEYVVDKKPFGLTTGENDPLKRTVRTKDPVYNDQELCEIKIKKYEDDGKTPIPGVEFELTFLEEAVKPNSNKNQYFQRLLKVGESIVFSTDENGELTFPNLDHGKYRITEVKTHPGNSLLKDPIEVTVPMVMTEEEASAYGNIDWGKGREDVNYTNNWFFYSCLFEITNHTTLRMPMTGGLGTWKYGFIGMGIIAMISTGLVFQNTTKKRRKHKKHKEFKI